MSSVQCKRTDTSNSIISCSMESFLADLKKDVQCSLCNDTLIEPKILPCFHTFCKLCIKRHAKLIEEANILTCPECKTETSLQELSSVEDLKSSLLHSRMVKVLEFAESQKVCSVCDTHCPVALWYCFDCNHSICEACFKFHSVFTKDHKIIRFTDMNKEDHESLLKNQDNCKTHSKQMLDIYCEDCDETICFVCLKLDHEEHKVMSLDKFTSINKDQLSEHLKTLEQLTVNKKEMKEQQEIAHKIQQDLQIAKRQVQDEVRKLIKILEENEEEMLRQIDDELNTATRNLNIIKHITAAKKYISNLIERGLASKRIRETDGYEDFIFNPFSKNSRITFVPNEELMLQARSGIGEITSYYEPDHTMSTAQESQPEATRHDNLFGQVFPQVNGGVYMLPMPQGHQRPFFGPPMAQFRPRWNMQQPQQQMRPGIPNMPTAGQVPRARGVRQIAPRGVSPQAGIPQCTQGREQSTFNASLSSQQQNYISCESKTVIMPNYKYACSVSKKPQIVPGGLEDAREGIKVPGHEPLLPSALAQVPLQEQKQMLGERLFSLIQTTHPELAGKITGMLLEIDNTELLHMLESRETLQAKVEEAVGVLKAYHAEDIEIVDKSKRQK